MGCRQQLGICLFHNLDTHGRYLPKVVRVMVHSSYTEDAETSSVQLCNLSKLIAFPCQCFITALCVLESRSVRNTLDIGWGNTLR